MAVVLTHFDKSVLRDVLANGDVAQERQHVVGAVGATKGAQEQGIVGSRESGRRILSHAPYAIRPNLNV
ncbi:hypothetical protein GCM10010471_13720 [Leucobacter komagatae]